MSTRALRILHTESSLGWGGQEIRVLGEARGVGRRGHQVAIAAPPESRIFQAAAAYGLEAIAVPIARKSLGGLRAMRALLRARPFDVVNTHSSTDSWLVALASAGRAGAPPLVRTRHISAPLSRNFATRWLYARATAHIVTTGERLREQVVEETGVAPARVVSIPTGIDLARFSPGSASQARAALGLPGGGRVIGIVATMRGWKGHSFLFEAFARLDEPDAMLLAVGDGPQREALGALAQQLGIADRVRFPGNQEDVAPWLRAMDVFCLPSWANEGVPQALMQAMACGIPVITTPVGSIAEIVTPGETGLLVPPRDSASLGAALRTLLADSPYRERLGRQARAAAEASFGEDRMVERMCAVFAAVARGTAPR